MSTAYKKIILMFSKNIRVYKFQLVVIGDKSVGKTTLLKRFSPAKERFLYGVLGLKLDDKTKVRLGLIDYTGGDDNFADFLYDGDYLRLFLKHEKINGYLLLFDVTNKDSLKNLQRWLHIVCIKDNVVKILVGNKCDLIDEQQRQVEHEEAKQYADLLNIPYFEISTLTGENMEQMFITAARQLINNVKKRRLL
ncbi:unnamed protein product [Didymodactylos carnosus]|uniref:Uncharacterized protein n=1 Tax=Didymodactylos carnosus TaxID=1234261 RepID=A0A815F9B5_9BILA|nr:unnamed protein product [Didymodactylos carnosus]CAF1322993.1 unnamed protein product [Didymodactylos carnosus]CAF3739139.1 unnamed protein product [Didymodactylos carnosus]CAF4170636.1 unnamed protein product [Didymodactylos carnosus]